MLGWTSVSRFCHVIGNFLEFPITQKGTNVPMMRTRAKQKHVANEKECAKAHSKYLF